MNTVQMIRLAPLALMLIATSLIATGVFNSTSTAGKHKGKALGNFSVERLDQPGILMHRDTWKDQVAVINVFASWCAPCRQEHEVLMGLARTGIVPIYGIAWRDKREQAISWLQRYGNPYQVIGFDEFGRTSIPFSLRGVPETLVVGRDGIVYFHHVSALTQRDVDEVIVPLVQRLNAQ